MCADGDRASCDAVTTGSVPIESALWPRLLVAMCVAAVASGSTVLALLPLLPVLWTPGPAGGADLVGSAGGLDVLNRLRMERSLDPRSQSRSKDPLDLTDLLVARALALQPYSSDQMVPFADQHRP